MANAMTEKNGNGTQVSPNNPGRQFRQLAAQIAGSLLKDWVGGDKAAEATGRISVAFSAAAASARDPKDFYACTPQSVAQCIAIAALTDIMPGTGSTALAYLVPQRPRRGEQPQLNFWFSHRGLNALARRTGQTMIAIPISYSDNLESTDDGEVIVAGRDIDNPPTSYGDLRGVMVLIRELATGATICRGWVPKKLIDQRKATSRSANAGSGPWKEWPVEMSMKGLALETPIPTPDGWTTMGDIQVGDCLFDMNGEETTVTAVSETKLIQCYGITFANGEQIVCDGEHRWFATTGTGGSNKRKRQGRWPVLSIEEMYNAKQLGMIVSIPVAEPIQCGWSDLPIHPWLLGYWIGNGNRSKASVCCDSRDANEIKLRIEEFGACTVGSVRKDGRSNACSIGLRGILEEMRSLEILNKAKHIPPSYLRASREQREMLLCGLVDSDGHVMKGRGPIVYSTTCGRLANEVYELVASLGETSHTRRYTARGFGKDVTAYTVSWTPSFECCTLSRKRRNLKLRRIAKYRGIKLIEKTASVATRCIAVASQTESYLAGRGMVPTHNTAMHYAIGRGWCVIDDAAAARGLSVEQASDLRIVEPGLIAGDPHAHASKSDALADALGDDSQEGSTDAEDSQQSPPIEHADSTQMSMVDGMLVSIASLVSIDECETLFASIEYEADERNIDGSAARTLKNALAARRNELESK